MAAAITSLDIEERQILIYSNRSRTTRSLGIIEF